MNFVILSNQRFDFPSKTNKWHIATRLAKLGHKVVFVDPPIRLRKALKLLIIGQISPISLFRGYKNVGSNLCVFMPLTITPTEKPNLFYFNYPKLLKLLKILRFSSHDFVLWVYHQVMVDYVDALKYRLLIYDCIDEYSKFPNFINRGLAEYVSEKEEYVARKAHIIFATTQSLVNKMKKFNKNVYFTPNVGDYERFKVVKTGALKITFELKGLKKPIIGFTGAIDDYKLNLSLVIKCAEKYPNYSFALVGPVGESEGGSAPKLLERLKSFSNVYLTGIKPYDEMPKFFEGFDAYIIPYNLNDYILGGCFPLKFHDALSAGLPTVVTNMPVYTPFKDVCYIAKGDDDFVRLIKRSLDENSPSKVAARRAVAKENSWDEKVKNQLDIISSHPKAKSSNAS